MELPMIIFFNFYKILDNNHQKTDRAINSYVCVMSLSLIRTIVIFKLLFNGVIVHILSLIFVNNVCNCFSWKPCKSTSVIRLINKLPVVLFSIPTVILSSFRRVVTTYMSLINVDVIDVKMIISQ